MKERIEYKTTNNRYVFNRLHKKMLEQDGEISCSYCGYHRSENGKGRKWYSGVLATNYVGRKYHDYSQPYEHWEVRYPNWKLVSKKKKQWMVRKVTKDTSWSGRGITRESFEFIF